MGLFDKFFGGLGKTRQKIDLEELFQDYAPDSEQFYEDLEEMLILADAGMPTAERVDYLMHRKTWEDRYRKGEEAREGLIKILTGLLDVGSPALKLDTKPSVILMVGVNGVGKTTTIGKLAHQLVQDGKKVMLQNSSGSGRSVPAVNSSAMRRAATPLPSSMTGSVRRKPAAPTSF